MFITAISGLSGKAVLLLPSSLDRWALALPVRDLQPTTQGWSSHPKKDAAWNQPATHIYGFNDKEREGQGLWKESFAFTRSPLPVPLLHIPTAAPHRCCECRVPPASSKQMHCNSYPRISTAKHSTDGCWFNERETHWCLLPQVFPPAWFRSLLMADGRSRPSISAREEAETRPALYPTLRPSLHVPWCGGIAPCHTPWAEKGPIAHSTQHHVPLGDWRDRGAPRPGWGVYGSIAPPALQPPRLASALKKQLKRKSILMPKVKEEPQTKRDRFFFSMRHLVFRQKCLFS